MFGCENLELSIRHQVQSHARHDPEQRENLRSVASRNSESSYSDNMAPPAVKRRKLSHSDSSEEDAASFSDSDLSATNGVEHFDDASSDEVDDSMEDAEDVEGGQSMDSEDEEDVLTEDDASENEEEEHMDTQPAKLSQVKRKQKTSKRRDEIPQDGVYTAEVYKSNMFKLQVDELLEQVRPKYGKKEAPAENAMRTLKAIIEQIPSREPLSVRSRTYSTPHTHFG